MIVKPKERMEGRNLFERVEGTREGAVCSSRARGQLSSCENSTAACGMAGCL